MARNFTASAAICFVFDKDKWVQQQEKKMCQAVVSLDAL